MALADAEVMLASVLGCYISVASVIGCLAFNEGLFYFLCWPESWLAM